jgi:Zn-finger nucleic acid-binding protein
MPAETLSCPMCGAAAATDASHCEHCGARLATAACPSCFGLLFVGQEFCPHCGAKADRQAGVAPAKPLPCPRCQTDLEAVVIGGNQMQECGDCEGLWLEAATLQKLCADREQQAALLGAAAHLPANEDLAIERHIRYVPCPICKALMNRVNFANCSNVIVDVCHEHGTWFDRDELRRVMEFIRDGGMEKAHEREVEELEERRRSAARPVMGVGAAPLVFHETARHEALSSVARVLLRLLGG